MIEHLEKFSGGPFRKSSESMYVSLNNRGILLMNRKAYEALSAPEAVVFYFDRKNSVIAVSPAHRSLKEAFPVAARDGHWYVRASSFCRHFRIRIERTEQFLYPKIDDKGLLRLDLTATVSAAQRRPRIRQAQRSTQ